MLIKTSVMIEIPVAIDTDDKRFDPTDIIQDLFKGEHFRITVRSKLGSADLSEPVRRSISTKITVEGLTRIGEAVIRE